VLCHPLVADSDTARNGQEAPYRYCCNVGWWRRRR